MGKMSNIDIEIQSVNDTLENKRQLYHNLFKVLPQSDINYMLKRARGNNKVAMVLALGDIKEE